MAVVNFLFSGSSLHDGADRALASTRELDDILHSSHTDTGWRAFSKQADLLQEHCHAYTNEEIPFKDLTDERHKTFKKNEQYRVDGIRHHVSKFTKPPNMWIKTRKLDERAYQSYFYYCPHSATIESLGPEAVQKHHELKENSALDTAEKSRQFMAYLIENTENLAAEQNDERMQKAQSYFGGSFKSDERGISIGDQRGTLLHYGVLVNHTEPLAWQNEKIMPIALWNHVRDASAPIYRQCVLGGREILYPPPVELDLSPWVSIVQSNEIKKDLKISDPAVTPENKKTAPVDSTPSVEVPAETPHAKKSHNLEYAAGGTALGLITAGLLTEQHQRRRAKKDGKEKTGLSFTTGALITMGTALGVWAFYALFKSYGKQPNQRM